MKIYTVGEDAVTREILRRVLAYCSKEFEIISEFPVRGGQIESKLGKYNNLSEKYPVILLTDLDKYNCAPELLANKVPSKNENFIFNVAVYEAEAWLMADREGFAEYFGIKITDMPISSKITQGGSKELPEMEFDYKPSLYLMCELIKKSRNHVFKKQLTPVAGAKKGREYNDCLLPFIQNKWNVKTAAKNTDSLKRMIKRVKNLLV